MRQWETRGYKSVKPELPHQQAVFLLKGEYIALCNEHLTDGILAYKVQDLRDD